MIEISKTVDEFVRPERWEASLSNGETVYDDNRPQLKPAWERLADYCEENDLDITGLVLKIRGVEVSVAKKQDGYIHKKVAWGTSSTSGLRLCIGYINGPHCLIHEICSSGDSKTIRPGHKDYKGIPPAPYTIWKSEIRNAIANKA